MQDFFWHRRYDPEEGGLVGRFYLPALSCAKRYDRTTGYFSAAELRLAARGVENLVGNHV